MATKASGTLVLIIEKQHASWDLMCSTLPALELRFRRQPHIASARPLVGPSGPCTIVVVCACVELTNGLLLACIPSNGLLRLGWQQLDTHIMGLGADWSDTPCTVPTGLPSRRQLPTIYTLGCRGRVTR